MLWLWLFSGTAFGEVTVSLDALEHPIFRIQGAQFHLDEGGGKFSVRHLQVLGRSWKNLELVCAQSAWIDGQVDCRQGRLRLPDYSGTPIPVSIRQQGNIWLFELRPAPSERWKFRYGPDGKVQLDVERGSLKLLHALIPELRQEKIAGVFSGRVLFHKQKLTADLVWDEGNFSSQDGRQAAEKLKAKLSLSASQGKSGWQFDGQVNWLEGAAYIEPLFIQAAGQVLHFKGGFDLPTWSLDSLKLEWPDVGSLEGQVAGSLETGLEKLFLSSSTLNLNTLGTVLIRPLMESKAWPVMELNGQGKVSMLWQRGEVANLELSLKDVDLKLDSPDSSLEQVSGALSWNKDVPTQGQFSIGKLRFGRLESGTFELPLDIQPKGAALKGPMSIPILGSELVITHMGATFQGGDSPWVGKFGLSLYPVSLEEVTQLLDFPVMGGIISANLPSITYADGVASLDGDLIVQVFDGYLDWTDLRIIDLFGTVPRVQADVYARNLDLGQLTKTFSFGQITGFVDADVKGLEIAGWQPLAFDAKVMSSPGSYPRRISQKAVANITSVGGGGAAAAIQSSVLRFFEEFGYSKIGLSCRLENGICRMGGIESGTDGSTYTIIKGGGIPALTVMGYNRSVRWDELISRLQAAIRNSSGPVVK